MKMASHTETDTSPGSVAPVPPYRVWAGPYTSLILESLGCWGSFSRSPLEPAAFKETSLRRTVRLVLALFALTALAAPAALAAERMWIGFHDDPSFRWVGNR